VDIPVPEFLGTRAFSTDASTAKVTSGKSQGSGAPTSDLLTPDSGNSLALGPCHLDLHEIADFVDWSPFFSAWELHGRFPDILEDVVVGTEAKKLFADAQQLLARIIAEKRFTAKAVIGFWPANSVGDSVEVYDPAGVKNLDALSLPAVSPSNPSKGVRPTVLKTFHFLRQQQEKPADQFNHCLADYIAPKASAPKGISMIIGLSCGSWCPCP
jgi:5-methyltetrahydrofolate--homocysteine methyltransferase